MWMRMGREVSQIRTTRKETEQRRSHQILLGDGGAEAVVVGDEAADELVQAVLENLVHAAVLDARAGGACHPLRWSRASIGAGAQVETARRGCGGAGDG